MPPRTTTWRPSVFPFHASLHLKTVNFGKLCVKGECGRSGRVLSDLGDQTGFVGKLSRLVLGIRQLPVYMHVESAAAAFDETSGNAESVSQFGCQTDSLGFVVSLYAVGYRDIHVCRVSLRVLSHRPGAKAPGSDYTGPAPALPEFISAEFRAGRRLSAMGLRGSIRRNGTCRRMSAWRGRSGRSHAGPAGRPPGRCAVSRPRCS